MMMKLYTDGSYKQDSNIAGIGGYLINSENESVFEFSEIIEDPKMYEKHEILALEKGLMKCIDLGIKKLHCFSDEEQLCKICNVKEEELLQKYIIKNPKLSKIIDLLPNFTQIDFQYIPREENKKADYLANKAIKHLLTNKKFEPENINCVQHFDDNSKQIFNTIKSQIEDFLIFEVCKEKEEYIVKSNRGFKNKQTKEIGYIFIENKIISHQDWIAGAISHIADTMKKTKQENKLIDNIGFMLFGEESQPLDKILRGQIRLSKQIKSELENLDEVAKDFKRVIIHESRDIIDLIREREIKEKETKKQISPKDFIINAIKELGDNYKIGQNKEIENYFNLPESKKDNIIEIQKKYFGELVKIKLMEIRESSANKEKIDLIALRSGLEKDGIKFTY